jgi:hypothetical protein
MYKTTPNKADEKVEIKALLRHNGPVSKISKKKPVEIIISVR